MFAFLREGNGHGLQVCSRSFTSFQCVKQSAAKWKNGKW